MKRLISLLMVFAFALGLCACANEAQETTQIAEGAFNIYYIEAGSDRLTSVARELAGTNETERVAEMFAAMLEGDDEHLSAIPSQLSYKASVIDSDILNVYFTGNLEAVTPAARLLFAAAVTRTLTQLPEVAGIMLYVNDEILRDQAGKSFGILRTSNFVNNAADAAEDYRESEITLFFANEKGDMLVKSIVKATYRSTATLERVIVESLISGPSESGLYAAVPPTTTLLSITTRDSICYVNLDSKFINETLTGFDAVPVYAIVNSLTQLDGVSQVQLSINGVSDISMPLGEISLSQPFSYNEDIIS